MSWTFIHHGISWALLQRIMGDQARIVDEKEGRRIRLTETNAADIMAKLKKTTK